MTHAAHRAIVPILVVLGVGGVPLLADDVRLRSRAEARGPEVTLGDIADLSGDDAAALRTMIVGRFGAGQATVRIALRDVRQCLQDGGVNWALLSLKGFGSCQVTRGVAQEAVAPAAVMPDAVDEAVPFVSAEAPIAAPAVVLANPRQAVGVDTPMTLRDRALNWIEEWTGIARSALRISWSERDLATLAAEAVGDRYEFAPRSRSTLGRLALQIHRYRGDELVDTYTLNPEVERRVIAVVAKRTISRRDMIAPDQVELREVYLDRDDLAYLTDPEEVTGTQAATLLRADTIVQARHVRIPPVIKKGDLVQVRCFVGNLVITTQALALDDGARDDAIRVRNERRDSRLAYTVRVTGPRQAVLDRHDVSAPPAAPGAVAAPDRFSNLPRYTP